MESPNASGPEPEPDLMDGLPDADLLLAIEDHQAQSSSVVPVAEPQKKKRAFKRKPAQLPDDYKKLKEIPKVDKEKHSKRWLKAQEMRRGIVRPQRKNQAMKLLKYTSHTYYNNLWAEAQMDMRNLLREERRRGALTGPDRKKMFAILSDIFQRYLLLYKKLDETYDQMVHPQKRILVRRLLDMIIARVLEIRTALVAAEQSEYFYFDELCYIQRIPPEDLDIPIPKYYFFDPSEQTLQRDQWFENIKKRKAQEEADRLDAERKAQAKQLAEDKWLMGDEEGHEHYQHARTMDVSSFLILIQTMERARQGRNRYRITKYMVEEEARALTKKKRAKKRTMDINKAVVIIQKLVRGFLARTRVKRMRDEELELLGLRFSTPGDQSSADRAHIKCTKIAEDLEKAKERRRQARRRNQTIYEEARVAIQQRLQLLEAPEMAERFKYQLRTWMLDVKEKTGKLPAMIPKAEAGGSRFFICPNQLSDEMLEKGREATDKEYAKKKKAERKKEKKKAKAKKAKEKKNAMKGIIDLTVKLDPPAAMDDMISSNIEYNKIWRGRDEKDNPEQKHEEKFIIHEKRQLIGDEVRKAVDTALIAELKVLKEALENKKKKGKKGKRAKAADTGEEDPNAASALSLMRNKRKPRKVKRRPKRPEGEQKKKKKGKDMTKDTPMEFLFQELVDNGIVKRYPEVRLDTLIGSCSLINGEIRSYHEQNPMVAREKKINEERPMPGDANPLPTFGDVKRAIKDICILPMGSKDVHTMSPHIKSILICGPEGSGKHTFVNAICTELHATMFDLTATNIVGKYPGKKGLKMLMHLVDKVGKAVSPLVIKIDNCEKTYARKVPKTDKTEPKRLKKQVGKMLDHFNSGDQILLIGISSEPWMCSAKFLKKDYQKVIYIPRPDYGSRMEIWRHLLISFADYMHKDVHFSLLNKLSDGWTIGKIKKVVDVVISAHKKVLAKAEKDKMYRDEEPWMLMESGGKRVSTMGKKLIRLDQFIEELSTHDPVFVEQDKAWNKFFNQTPLQKARLSNQIGGLETGKKKKKGKK